MHRDAWAGDGLEKEEEGPTAVQQRPTMEKKERTAKLHASALWRELDRWSTANASAPLPAHTSHELARLFQD
eukprot:COSAG06_NODE_2351_length_7027_cov_6.426963_1_plen_72_part_00